MTKDGYYSSGQFAKMAHISVRTVRYYDKMNILKPSYVTEAGARFYTDLDFVRLQQIMLLKYLGFSLDDIRELIVGETDYQFLANSLELQRKLIQDKIEKLQMVEKAIGDTTREIREKKDVDWSQMLELIHMTGMENTLKTQYQNSSNITARIQLHSQYSQNKQGWFPWIYEQCGIKEDMKILEIGCGNARLWLENQDKLPQNVEIVLSDVSEGIIREIRRNSFFQKEKRFSFGIFNCQSIPFEAENFDLVIANHMLFYCEDISKGIQEICRVLKPGGTLIASTYGKNHMKELTDLVQQFDSRITLAAEKLYELFGKENGDEWLTPFFETVEWLEYSDSLIVDKPEPVIEYILSCHGNQNQYILERYNKFRSFVTEKMKKSFPITKEAGIFRAKLKKRKKCLKVT